ncbi:MAG: metallophosphoesterase [Candidatus Korarchaeota archaeon]
MIRFLATGDWHGKRTYPFRVQAFAKSRDVDAILCIGDIVHKEGIDKARELFREIKIPLFFVPGNTDPPELASYSEGNIVSVHGRTTVYQGITIAGVGGTPPTPFDSTFILQENEITTLLDKLTSTISHAPMILLTHAPPQNTKLEVTWKRERGGSQAIYQYIIKYQPALVVCGHIHEAHGTQMLGKTLCVNTGSLPYAAIIEVKNTNFSCEPVRIPPSHALGRDAEEFQN